mmetsp:Transcript_67235/g.176966  ORF Transcript_67235/g.176966 Transcript_67235/m.176966 type:complete len:240 (+) Transcript_67235:1-720(+)
MRSLAPTRTDPLARSGAGAEAADEARLDVAHDVACKDLHEAAVVAREASQILQHLVRAEVGVPGGPLLDAVGQRRASHELLRRGLLAADEQGGCALQHDAADGLALKLLRLADLHGEEPGALHADGVEGRDAATTGQLNEVRLATCARLAHDAEDLGGGAARSQDNVALGEAADGRPGPVGELYRRGAVDAGSVAIVVLGHVDRCRCRSRGRGAATAAAAAPPAPCRRLAGSVCRTCYD